MRHEYRAVPHAADLVMGRGVVVELSTLEKTHETEPHVWP